MGSSERQEACSLECGFGQGQEGVSLPELDHSKEEGTKAVLPWVSTSPPPSLTPSGSFTGHQEGKNTHLEVTQYQCKGGNKDCSDVPAWTHLGFSLTQRSSSSPFCFLLQSKDLLCAGVLQTSLVIFSNHSLQLSRASTLVHREPAQAGTLAANGVSGHWISLKPNQHCLEIQW